MSQYVCRIRSFLIRQYSRPALPPFREGRDFSPARLSHICSRKNSVGTGLLNYVDVLVGSVSGPMGATCSIALFGALLFLAVRRPKKFHRFRILPRGLFYLRAPVSARADGAVFVSAFMEICGGTLFVFHRYSFLTDDKLLPKSFLRKDMLRCGSRALCV